MTQLEIENSIGSRRKIDPAIFLATFPQKCANADALQWHTFTDDDGITWRLITRFFVPGEPAPGGSKTAMPIMRGGRPVCGPGGRPITTMVEGSSDSGRAKTKNWRAVVALAASQAYRGPLLNEAISIEVKFVMPRIKGHYRTGKHAGELKPDAPVFHTVKPDALKLMRSTEDAMSQIIYRDDSLIGDEKIRKVYGDSTGAIISVYVQEKTQ